MTKELEALKQVKNFLGHNYCSVDLPNELRNIEQALQRLEEIDNAKPNEALESLENIEADLIGLPKHVTEYDDGFDNYLEDIWYNINTIKQALLKAQEQEKVLNSIIEHLSFKYSGTEEYIDFRTNQKVKKYMFEIESKDTGATIHIHLDTQEEFDLLKRYFDEQDNK